MSRNRRYMRKSVRVGEPYLLTVRTTTVCYLTCQVGQLSEVTAFNDPANRVVDIICYFAE